MSIVTYENVDTPVFEIDFLRYLFANGEQGALWGPLPYYSDAAGTVEAGWGDPVGFIPDASGNGNDWTQVTSTARPILRDSPPRMEFDGTDDLVPTTLPAISGGTIVLAGTNGIWIDEIDFAGGAFSVGPDTYTGGPAGLIPILGDLLVGGCFVIDRALTPEEIAQVERYYKARGSAGLMELGPELVEDMEFDDPSYWTINGGQDNTVSVSNSMATFSESPTASLARTPAELLTLGFTYLVQAEAISASPYGYLRLQVGAGPSVNYGPSIDSPGLHRAVLTLGLEGVNRSAGPIDASGPKSAELDSFSVRRLIMPGEAP